MADGDDLTRGLPDASMMLSGHFDGEPPGRLPGPGDRSRLIKVTYHASDGCVMFTAVAEPPTRDAFEELTFNVIEVIYSGYRPGGRHVHTLRRWARLWFRLRRLAGRL